MDRRADGSLRKEVDFVKSLQSLLPCPCNWGCSVCISVCLATAQIVSVLSEAMPSWHSHHTHSVFVDSYRIISHCRASSAPMFPHRWVPPPPQPCLPCSLISFQPFALPQAPELFTDNLLSQVKDQSYPGRMWGEDGGCCADLGVRVGVGGSNTFHAILKPEPETKKLHYWPQLYLKCLTIARQTLTFGSIPTKCIEDI